MKYYLKRLGHQELGSVKNGKAQRGRYIYISKDKNVLDIFPPLSKTVTNDSSIIPIIPLYQKVAKKIYCNYIYHNDKYNVSGGTRNEYRIYCNGALEGKQLLFQPDDILRMFFSYIDVAIRTQNCIGCAKSLLMNLILGEMDMQFIRG